jgi:hypothetical protein
LDRFKGINFSDSSNLTGEIHRGSYEKHAAVMHRFAVFMIGAYQKKSNDHGSVANRFKKLSYDVYALLFNRLALCPETQPHF